MELFFSPLACSLASRIALYEAGAEARYSRVDTKAGRTEDGADYLRINPKGLVPALRTQDGEVLTENAAVLQFIADHFPEAALMPSGFERYRAQQWLSFIGTELHKFVFAPLFSRRANDEAKAFARAAAPERFAYLEDQLDGREYLVDTFSVADAYLAVVLNWAQAVNFDLSPYPNIRAYHQRVLARPAAGRAFQEELALYQAA
ncbi:glutathione binding-like protein [Phenylobacterium deserti]|uniref:Glutathione S-transferase n=1 Tax=Phenylobacterium deserti TaxID=1914756 RepID=A0A328AUI0_9CAUL|nr:glutathione binding-like protein [Phenylobacterium deserti]RAK57184.1 glutathione S-transferase [Phenylobacterium deserti]